MDWVADLRDPTSVDRLPALVEDHLRRYAASGEGVDAALQQVRDAVARQVPAEGSLRARLEWRGEEPVLSLAPVLDESALAGTVEPLTPLRLDQRRVLEDVVGAEADRLVLPVPRRLQRIFDSGPPPTVLLDVDPRSKGAAGLALALAAAAETHPAAGPAQTASLAGAAMADAVAAADPVHDLADAGRLLVEAHQALGSDARLLVLDDDHLELAVARCPFGATKEIGESLCHVSTGLAGRMAARVAGSATVLADETIAAGDAECHLQVWLTEPAGDVRGERHRWPPTTGRSGGATPQLELSLNLPREGASVPVVRRLAAQALRAFGVQEDDVHDVQLAITEACANVIDHAVDTDTYEVRFELARHRCAISVVDQGGGFDATAVPDAQHGAEGGRGLTLMRALVDNVAFTSEPRAGAVVHMVKHLSYDEEHPFWQDARER